MVATEIAKPPIIVTRNLTLTSPLISMASDVFDYAKDKSFAAALEREPLVHEGQAAEFLQDLMDTNAATERLYWAVQISDNGKVIGTLGLIHSSGFDADTMEFGYGFSPVFWGSGYFQEAAHAVLDYGFKTMNLHRVIVRTRSRNVRAIKSVIKIGFREHRVIKGYYENDSEVLDLTVLALDKSRFMDLSYENAIH